MSVLTERIRRFGRRQNLIGYLFLLPAIALGLLLFAYPIYLVTNISLHDLGVVNLRRLESAPLTLANYVALLTGADLGATILRSAIYVVGVTVPAFVIGLASALLFNQNFRGNRILRTLTLVPWAVPGVVAGAAFLWLLDGSYGAGNFILMKLGVISEYIPWLARPDTAMLGVIVPSVWKEFPFFTLILLAALQNIPTSLYEAARMDGAGWRHQFTKVTWPGIRSSALLASLLGALTAFREFDLIYSLTRGGPIGATETLAVRIYNEFFVYFNGGLSAAIAILTMLICAGGVWLLYPHIKKEFF